MTGLSEETASLEKLQRAEAATKIAIWSELGSWEGPLREFARLSNPEEDLDRRLKFFRWEIASRVEQAALEYASGATSPELELEALNAVFFEDLGFRNDKGIAALDTVLAKRIAPPALLAMLYAWVAELFFRALREQNRNDSDECGSGKKFFKRIDLVFDTPAEVVRAVPCPSNDVGRVILLDLDNKGHRVADGTWCAWAEKSANGFVTKSMAEALIAALTELFVSLDFRNTDSSRAVGDTRALESLQRQLAILDMIIALQPSETKRLADRAVLKTRLGQNQRALDDLKRFFAFHEKSQAPAEIVSLFETLNNPANPKGPEWN